MATIVFGSPEAKAVIEKDKEVYGDSRYPGDEPPSEGLREYKITTSVTVVMNRTYYVEALTEAEARETVRMGRDWDNQEENFDLGDERIEAVETVEEGKK
jgi:hypothetical protein